MSSDQTGINPEQLAAYKDVIQVMLGFRTRQEMEDVFDRPVVWSAVKNLSSALEQTRERSQPDEFALALAIEAELLRRFSVNDDVLEAMFNDPAHHTLPPAQLDKRIAAAWAGKTSDPD